MFRNRVDPFMADSALVSLGRPFMAGRAMGGNPTGRMNTRVFGNRVDAFMADSHIGQPRVSLHGRTCNGRCASRPHEDSGVCNGVDAFMANGALVSLGRPFMAGAQWGQANPPYEESDVRPPC